MTMAKKREAVIAGVADAALIDGKVKEPARKEFAAIGDTRPLRK